MWLQANGSKLAITLSQVAMIFSDRLTWLSCRVYDLPGQQRHQWHSGDLPLIDVIESFEKVLLKVGEGLGGHLPENVKPFATPASPFSRCTNAASTSSIKSIHLDNGYTQVNYMLHFRCAKYRRLISFPYLPAWCFGD